MLKSICKYDGTHLLFDYFWEIIEY